MVVLFMTTGHKRALNDQIWTFKITFIFELTIIILNLFQFSLEPLNVDGSVFKITEQVEW